MRTLFSTVPVALLLGLGATSVTFSAGCQPCELPVTVFVPDGFGWEADAATAEWSSDDGATWADCEPGTSEGVWQCGPEDDSFAGTVMVRVTAADVTLEGSAEVEADDSCLAQTELALEEADASA